MIRDRACRNGWPHCCTLLDRLPLGLEGADARLEQLERGRVGLACIAGASRVASANQDRREPAQVERGIRIGLFARVDHPFLVAKPAQVIECCGEALLGPAHVML